MSAKPDARFRAGSITATIWKNEQQTQGKKFSYFSVSVDRSYKDREGQWQRTPSMRVNDLPKANLVINKAYEYLATKSDEVPANGLNP